MGRLVATSLARMRSIHNFLHPKHNVTREAAEKVPTKQELDTFLISLRKLSPVIGILLGILSISTFPKT
jgi:hypothetical protein